MQIIFVRHGETDTNLRHKQGLPIIDDNAPLNQKGIEQAKAVAEKLKSAKVDVIFTSPMRRAAETAAEIAKFHPVPFIELENLKERGCGVITGSAFHDLFDFDKDIRGEDIEPVGDFFRRVYTVMDRIKASGYENILVVSHGGVYHAVNAYFKNLAWRGNLRTDRLKNCEFRVYEVNSPELDPQKILK